MKNRFAYYVLPIVALVAVVILSACSAGASAPAPAPTSPPAPTAIPATAVPPTAAAPTAAAVNVPQQVTIKLASNDKLGKFLSDSDGRTLYLFTKDTKDTSNCYDKCAASWPPLLSKDKAAVGDGLDASHVGTTTRKDGTTQVTYNGWPLYYYTPDAKPGDVNGQAVGKVWWVVSGEGNIVKPAALKVGQNDKLGKFLVDDQGRSLYIFTKDSKDTTVCYDKCEAAWPPLLTVGTPTVDAPVDASLLGTTTRKDGSTQVTYKGMPLYYYTPDAKPGDVNGQGVGNVWYVVAADGTIVK